jgi:hypothetical protein
MMTVTMTTLMILIRVQLIAVDHRDFLLIDDTPVCGVVTKGCFI